MEKTLSSIWNIACPGHMETDTVMQHNNTHDLAEPFPFDGQRQGVEGLQR